ncbi:helix-turn-helix domain-containing protein [Providencia rettgeri]|uniref:helix-turn-helix domain-containing protein n=1 Tax=Providencia rettgeri TaxID=587 RepID=UPI001B360CEF|nr:helix-turn-helix transcriptional regulator [Providencia rettgeri]MBQ0369043.1 helix-turn-helix transcriptional regulator [Providencia rettgeri]
MIINRVTLEIDTGNFIKRCRISKSMTGKQLGEILNVSQQQISRYECGITSINIHTLQEILIALDKNWHDFFFSILHKYSTKQFDIKDEELKLLILNQQNLNIKSNLILLNDD